MLSHQGRNCGVVVEEDHLGSPGQDGWEWRMQHEIDRRNQRLRPVFDCAKGVAAQSCARMRLLISLVPVIRVAAFLIVPWPMTSNPSAASAHSSHRHHHAHFRAYASSFPEQGERRNEGGHTGCVHRRLKGETTQTLESAVGRFFAQSRYRIYSSCERETTSRSQAIRRLLVLL